MKRLFSSPSRVYDFVRRHMPLQMVSGAKGIGLEIDGEVVAGVIYESYNGHNVWMHVAVTDGGVSLTRGVLRTIFDYPFNQMRVARVSGYVEASNEASRKFCEQLGYRQEAVLSGAASDGGDVIIYAMRREDCRFLKD